MRSSLHLLDTGGDVEEEMPVVERVEGVVVTELCRVEMMMSNSERVSRVTGRLSVVTSELAPPSSLLSVATPSDSLVLSSWPSGVRVVMVGTVVVEREVRVVEKVSAIF